MTGMRKGRNTKGREQQAIGKCNFDGKSFVSASLNKLTMDVQYLSISRRAVVAAAASRV